MENFLISKLVKDLDIYDPEELIITLIHFDIKSETPYADLSIRISTIEEEKEGTLRIKFHGLNSFKISSYSANEIYYSEDHPLLWDFSDLQISLYFVGAPEDVYKAFWELKQIERQLYGNYSQIDRYLNNGRDFINLMKGGNGLLASGPKKLMEEIINILATDSLKFSLVNEREPDIWDGEKLISSRQFSSVLLFGDSYIIANKIEVDFLEFK